jgi:hypothetical protein
MASEGTKGQLILAIQDLNHSASDEFLAQFTESNLREYLASLRRNVRPLHNQASSVDPQQVAGVA